MAIYIGHVSAYAIAKANGYEGTEEEFGAMLGQISITLGDLTNLRAVATTRAAGSQATASYADGVLTLGIPRGDKGETGNGIQSVAKTGTSGTNPVVDTYTITYTNGQTTTFQITNGIKGDTGATPELTIGTVTTGEVGSDAAATITGTPEHPVLGLTLPRGATGDVTNLAGTFSSASAYSAGDYVIYNDLLYVFNADHAAGSWTGTDATQVKVGTELSALKEDINEVYSGDHNYPKDDIPNSFELYSTDYLYSLEALVIGVSKINNINRYGSAGAKAYIIPLEGISSITYPVFKSSSNLGSFMFDEDDTIIWMYTETTADTGTEKTFTVPENASYMLLSVSASLNNVSGWYVETKRSENLNDIYITTENMEDKVEKLYGKHVTKAEALATDVKISNELLYILNGVQVGVTTLSEVTTSGTGGGGYALKVPLNDVKSITYPVFKSSSNAGSLMFDENDVVTWYYSETSSPTGSLRTVNVPSGTEYMLLSISGSLEPMDWSYTLYALSQVIDDDAETVTPFENTNKNMCLAAIKTDILTNKIPYHRGYLFHKLQNNDFSLWYGEDFENINKIGSITFSPNYWRFAISPKDGRLISVKRDERSGIRIWDGTTETLLDGFTSNPQAWLYNSGIDFIMDGTDEYCVFAEYSGSVYSGYDLHVWRGKYPYTSASDWSIVMTKTQVTDITHFHMVRRDPWTNILYLTAGDSSAESKWWYSTDKGATWTLLVSGTDTGWGNSLCRTINFVFTKDYIYWATDHGEAGAQHHTLNRIARDSDTGIMDLSTKEQLALLPQLYATNSLCYVESPNGLFMYDRIDVGSSSVFGEPIKMMFWDFATEELVEVASLKLTVNDWGGSRGKCYLNYTNGRQPMPAMGFSIDTPCIFDLVCDNPSNIGTIAYDVGSKTIRTIDY